MTDSEVKLTSIQEHKALPHVQWGATPVWLVLWWNKAHTVSLVGLEAHVYPEHRGSLTLRLTIRSSSNTMNMLSRYISGLNGPNHKRTLMASILKVEDNPNFRPHLIQSRSSQIFFPLPTLLQSMLTIVSSSIWRPAVTGQYHTGSKSSEERPIPLYQWRQQKSYWRSLIRISMHDLPRINHCSRRNVVLLMAVGALGVGGWSEITSIWSMWSWSKR